MKKINKEILWSVQVVVIALIISAFGSYVFAASFAEPTCAPTGCNADAPLNVSGTAQIKSGGLIVAAGTGITTGLAVVTGKVGIGTASPTHALDITTTGGTDGAVQASAFYYASDRNLKNNIAPLSNSLDKVMQLQGVSYNWKSNGKADVGLVAQDVQKVYPELVSSGASGLSVDYGHLIGPMIEAIKEQQKEINQLKAEINQLKGQK
ncbi:MAG TPA: tail fiber domain-containing protein [Candidatus Paceibacterota bacterium]|nr:tail fiber domain-containing protein [Candidatus Paceibacterota bacterium]